FLREPQGTVIPLFSECKAPKEDDVVSLACLVKGYFPEPVQVTWEPEMQNQKPWTFPAMKKGQEYIHVFSLTTWWKPGSHSCTVHHKPRNGHSSHQSSPLLWQSVRTTPTLPSMTQLLPTAASAPRSLTVHALTTPGLNASPGATSWLQCKVSGFSPPEIVLTWLEGQREVDPSWFATARPTAQPGNTTFQTWSILLVPTIPGPPTATYTCVVGHEASRQLLNTSWSLDTGGESHRGTGASVPQSRQQDGMEWQEGV
uniref:Ig-like domain-containing protein n=1 Tax=Equus caballus TaxID=9796 RepID=A0A3Q2LNK2_HORSE